MSLNLKERNTINEALDTNSNLLPEKQSDYDIVKANNKKEIIKKRLHDFLEDKGFIVKWVVLSSLKGLVNLILFILEDVKESEEKLNQRFK